MERSPTTYFIPRLRAGRPSALAALYARFAAVPARVAGARANPDDIANSVFFALWTKAQADAPLLRQVTNSATLVSALARLTRDHLSRRYRDATRLKRDNERTEPLGASVHAIPAPVVPAPPDVPPELTARQREIVAYRASDWEWEDIARLVGVSARTLYREVERIRAVYIARGDAPVGWQSAREDGR